LAAEKGDSPEERRKQIFRLYVEQMFQRRRTTSLVFPKEKTISRLSWLARKLQGHSQSVFLVEGLQPSWLGTRAERLVYGTVVALGLGLIFGLSTLSDGLIFGLTILVGVGLGCWSESPLKNGVMCGSIGGPIFGLAAGLSNGLSVGLSYGLIFWLIGGLGIGSLNHITLVETVSWKWNRFWKRAIPGSIVGLISGLIIGLIVGLIVGLINGLFFGLISGLVGGFTDRVKVGKTSPNQGIKLSLKNSLAAFLVTGLTTGLAAGLSNGLSNGLIGGLIVGLNRGGSAVIKHYALRLIL
jgi:hypothetical protein